MKNLLKVRRWQAGMKQYELATKLNCSAPYLSVVENGRVDPPEAFKVMVARILSVSVEDIFPRTESAERTLK
jgi:DNA-binding XRE family transcriptional regulator